LCRIFLACRLNLRRDSGWRVHFFWESECFGMAVKEQVSPKPEQVEQADFAMKSEAFRYSPKLFLRAMLVIAWSAFAHPFSSTVIDLATGQVSHQAEDEEE